MVRIRVRKLRAILRAKGHDFLKSLDEERIGSFQAMYYYFIITAGLYLLFVADGPPQNVEPVMGEIYYHLWLALNIICPLMTLLGKALTRKAGMKDPNDPNPAVGAAWFQLAGDFGVWCSISIFIVCFFQTAEWGDSVYGLFFVLMGVPGGAMFTLRSYRRISQIRKREKRLA